MRVAAQQHQIYVPPKIWSEEYDSDDSANDVQAQPSCWKFGAYPKRGEKRNGSSYATTSKKANDESRGFCGVFVCGDLLDHEEDRDEETLGSHRRLPKDNEPSSPDTVVTSVMMSDFDNDVTEVREENDLPEGVEHTLDTFWVTAAVTRDVDCLSPKSKKKRGKKRLLKRRKGSKQQKVQEENTETPVECDDDKNTETPVECDDGRMFVSIESTSTTGDSTVISIKHVIPDMDFTEESSNVNEEMATVHVDNDCSKESPSLFEEPLLPPQEGEKEKEQEQEECEQQSTLAFEDTSKNATVQVDDSPSEPKQIMSYMYESLGQDDSDDEVAGSPKNDKPIDLLKPSEAFLKQVLDAFETGVKVLSFPDIPPPRKKRTGRRVHFAPDVKFNDDYKEYDYSLDYSYSDPEFDDEESFYEEMQRTPKEDEVDDDDDFFDDTPTPKAVSTEPTDHVESSTSSGSGVQSPISSTFNDEDSNGEDVDSSDDEDSIMNMSDHEIEESTSMFEDDSSRCDNINVSDDDDDDCSLALVSKVSAESGFGYFNADTGETGEDGDRPFTMQQSLPNQSASPSSPYEPPMKSNASVSQYDYIGIDANLEGEGDEDGSFFEETPAYKSFEEMMVIGAVPSTLSSEEDLGSSLSYDINYPSISTAEEDVATKHAKLSKKPLKPPQQLDDGKYLVRSEPERTEIEEIITAIDDRNDTHECTALNETNVHADLVERYLDIPSSPTGMKSVKGKPQSDTSFEDGSKESTSDDVASENCTGKKVVDEEDNFPDWFYSVETRDSQSVDIDECSTKKNEVAREGWTTSPCQSTEAEERKRRDESGKVVVGFPRQATTVDPFISSACSKNNKVLAKHLRSPARRYKANLRIIDKKECLQLSLQGFARSKHTSDWANFNNAPFQDLEVAPFDEM